MGRFFSIFWMVFEFFFAIPFPMLLYYNIKSESGIGDLKDKNPWLAFTLLVASVILWGILLICYFRKWLLAPFVTKRRIEQLKTNGICREADILSAVKIPVRGNKYDNYELLLSFENLAGTKIEQKAAIIDGKPDEHRFEVGKKTPVRIDKDLAGAPYFIFANADVTIRGSIIALIALGWLSFLAVIVGYYIFSYNTENNGAGWRFMFSFHPLTVCPAMIIFYGVLEAAILGKLSGISKKAPLIKFKGIRTTARLISANQTGLYINEQPQVEFSLEYTDERQRVHKASIKKIVDLLDLSSTRQKNVDIFYLREDTSCVAFASDLDEIS